ncbi:hypothetical protein PA598K_04337 [Paenibacillus sp. 598K]|uniref:hypothetical protein n=1 Tax=Paenibacillus sp. 598K TaxID=1117987 RepID=UPI000FFA8FFF|nr:hypothetical protein [Paenibacillus sp. 598K]GBF75903.1 hypothetical protein PA598K_04337 [Paenibacillus sp. 598K]
MKSNRKALWGVWVMSLALVAACSNDPAPGADPPAPPGQQETLPEETQETDTDEQLLGEFRQTIRDATGPSELIAFLDERLPVASESAADRLLLELEAYYAEDLPKLQGRFLTNEVQEKFSMMGDPTKVEQITDDELRAWTEQAEAGHYVLVQTAGEVYPVVDYTALDKYRRYLSSDLSDYLKLMTMDSQRLKSGTTDSASTLEAVAERAIASEQYLERYPEGLKRDEILSDYINRTEYLLFGMANGPRFDLDSGILFDEYRQVFERIADTRGDTYTGTLVRRLLELLGESDQKLIIVSSHDRRDVPAIAELRDGLAEQIREHYGEPAAAS